VPQEPWASVAISKEKEKEILIASSQVLHSYIPNTVKCNAPDFFFGILGLDKN